jgi:ATP-dependent Zn protease
VRKTPLDNDIDLKAISIDKQTEGFSGADLGSLLKESALYAILAGKKSVAMSDVQYAMTKVYPSLTPKDRKSYE